METNSERDISELKASFIAGTDKLIDTLICRLDRYFFDRATVDRALQCEHVVWLDDDGPIYLTERLREAQVAKCLAHGKLRKLLSEKQLELLDELEETVDRGYEAAQQEMDFLKGMVLGLKLAGVPNDLAARMAKMWTDVKF